MMIKNWLIAFRLKTLTAAFVPILMATSIVAFEGYDFDLWISVFAILSALFIQIATNLFNDAIDFKKGADTDERVGPRRVTQSGLISSSVVYKVAFGFCFLAMVCGVPLVLKGGLPIVALGLISLVMAYLYTGGPYPLAYRGLGDLFVILFFGLAAVCGTYYLHTGVVSLSSIIAGFQIGFLSTVLIAINNLRDHVQDREVNKKTLAVRFGKLFTRIEILLLYLVTYFLLFYWYEKGAPIVSYLCLITLPIAMLVLSKVWSNEPGPIYNKYLGISALVHALFGILFSVGLLL